MMKNTKKNMFKQQEHRSFMDWFIATPAKITIIGYQIELKMHDAIFTKTHGKGMKGLPDVGQAHRSDIKTKRGGIHEDQHGSVWKKYVHIRYLSYFLNIKKS